MGLKSSTWNSSFYDVRVRHGIALFKAAHSLVGTYLDYPATAYSSHNILVVSRKNGKLTDILNNMLSAICINLAFHYIEECQ